VTLLCPGCGAPSRFSRELVRCRSCGEPLPEELIVASERALRRGDALGLMARVLFRGPRQWDCAAVTQICPSCKLPSAFDAREPERCGACGEVLPPELADATSRALRRQRPLGLTVGLWSSAICGLLFFASGTCLGALLALGWPPPGTDPPSALAGALFGAVLLVIAFGIRAERRWVRPLAVAFWLLPAPFGLLDPELPAGELATGLCSLVVPAAIAAWYFFVDRRVVGYYEELRRG